MPRGLQVRYAKAVLKMRENKNGVPGTSEYFRLAVVHGGMPELDSSKYPVYCVHGREAFPNWHRPYMLEFERALRRSDVALGGDGTIGLPYWDWSETDVNGEVMPGIVREMLMVDFPDDFWPAEITRFRRSYAMDVASDAKIRAYLDRGSLAKAAADCLRSTVHAQHACTAFSTSANPTVESPHNTIHGVLGGMMGSYQSAFHPVFWLHHCNVDRLYEGYVALEPDSAAEFEAHQRSLGSDVAKDAGYPDGCWGPYLPFINFATGEHYHASETFDTRKLGFSYDAIPTPAPLRLREMPYYAVFSGIDLKAIKAAGGGPCILLVLVGTEAAPYTVDAGATAETLLAADAFAGLSTIFFLDTPATCSNCESREPWDEYVDVTAALRRTKIRPAEATLAVAVVTVATGAVAPLGDMPYLPAPRLRGPRFSSMDAALTASGGDEDDAAALAELLRAADGDDVWAKVRAFQRAAGLEVDGVVGPLTKKELLKRGLADDDEIPGARNAAAAVGGTVKYAVGTGPASMDRPALLAEIDAQFAKWAAASGVAFERADSDDGADLTLSWRDKTRENAFVFDGPGGALATATPSDITFDRAEKWELAGRPHRRRAHDGPGDDFFDPYFAVGPVLLHEIGHVLGLRHSADPADVMAPYYAPTKTELTENDVAAVKAALA